MRILLPNQFRNSSWLGVLWLIGAAAAIAVLTVYTTGVFNNAAHQQFSAAINDLGPAGSHQTQWW